MKIILLFQIQYRVKWLGYPATQNSWISVNHMDCDELIEQFELSRAWRVFGVKRVQNGAIEYGVEWPYTFDVPQVVPSQQAKQLWPGLVFRYLVEILSFAMPRRRVTFQDDVDRINETADLNGLPERILGCSDVSGELLFLCEWPQNQQKIIGVDMSNIELIRMFADYLENHLD